MSQYGNYTHQFETEPTKEGYETVGKHQAQQFQAELTDIAIRMNLSTVGDMERSGIHTAGDSLMSCIAKLNLLTSAL